MLMALNNNKKCRQMMMNRSSCEINIEIIDVFSFSNMIEMVTKKRFVSNFLLLAFKTLDRMDRAHTYKSCIKLYDTLSHIQDVSRYNKEISFLFILILSFFDGSSSWLFFHGVVFLVTLCVCIKHFYFCFGFFGFKIRRE